MSAFVLNTPVRGGKVVTIAADSATPNTIHLTVWRKGSTQDAETASLTPAQARTLARKLLDFADKEY